MMFVFKEMHQTLAIDVLYTEHSNRRKMLTDRLTVFEQTKQHLPWIQEFLCLPVNNIHIDQSRLQMVCIFFI